MSRIKDAVRAKLDGLEARNAQRAAARLLLVQADLVYRKRRSGELDDLFVARCWLKESDIPATERVRYGITEVRAAGVLLTYGPDGRMMWRRKRGDFALAPEQAYLLNGGTT